MEKRFGVVSADGHFRLMHLPFDLWTKRLPRKLQENAPRVVQQPDGTRQWVVEGRAWSGVGWSGAGRGAVNCYTRASDFPGLDSPWPNSRQMGHAPVEAALGKGALGQMVFRNAVSLYKIPVTGQQAEQQAEQQA